MTTRSKLKHRLPGRPIWVSQRNLVLSAVIILIAIAGVMAIIQSRAATFAVAFEAEDGQVLGNAGPGLVQGASGDASVKFGTPPAGGGNGKISIASYPGWIRGSIPPEQLHGATNTPYNWIYDFGYLIDPGAKTAELADYMGADQPGRVISTAHNAGHKVIMVIGSEGEGDNFAVAAQPQNRAKFIQSMIDLMQEYGHDGISIDWEEKVPENKQNYLALIRETRAALNGISPRPILMTDVISGLVPPDFIGEVHTHLDYLDVMSYWSDGLDQFNLYTAAGVPANKIILGIGISPSYKDDTVQEVQAKVDLVKEKGMAGTQFWQLGEMKSHTTDPRLQPLRDMVAGR